jgi:hypothetical protein
MTARRVWMVCWVVPLGDERDLLTHGRGVGECGHAHGTADEAFACPWEPTPLPPVGAGLVAQVRADDGRRRRQSAQLGLFGRPLRQGGGW